MRDEDDILEAQTNAQQGHPRPKLDATPRAISLAAVRAEAAAAGQPLPGADRVVAEPPVWLPPSTPVRPHFASAPQQQAQLQQQYQQPPAYQATDPNAWLQQLQQAAFEQGRQSVIAQLRQFLGL